jgi:potassium efflux system protein
MCKWLKLKIFLLVGLFLFSFNSYAEEVNKAVFQDKAQIVSQQIDLLKNRLLQAQRELTYMQHHQRAELATLSIDQVNKQRLNQAGLDVAIAKSNVDSIGIELAEAVQTSSRLEKDMQEIDNQLNVITIFGLKIARNSVPNIDELKLEKEFQQNLLSLEKNRSDYLLQLQTVAAKTLDLYKTKYDHIDALLKSQTVMQLKEQQAKSELVFQQQQSEWLARQNNLNAQLNHIELTKNKDTVLYQKLVNEIFYTNENVNFIYLQMLIARYQDQIQELKISISRTGSVNLLNKMGDQAQMLSKQISRVDDLLKNRVSILQKQKSLLPKNQYFNELQGLEVKYQSAIKTISELNQQVSSVRLQLDQALKQELSSRQSLPNVGTSAWFDVGAELVLIPSLFFQAVKNLSLSLVHSIQEINSAWLFAFVFLEILWVQSFSFIRKFLNKAISGVPDHEYGHINLKWLGIKLASRMLIDFAVIGNLIGIFYLCGIPSQSFSFFLQISIVWLFFKGLITTSRLCLVETVHDRAGHDVRLFHRLKWSFVVGGMITSFTVFVNQLPVIYEVKDLFIRLFLLFLLVVAIFLIKSWRILAGLVMPYIDERHIYFRRIIHLLFLLIPLIFLANSVIGLLGYVNLVLTVSWYQGIFLLVLVGYLSLRGLLSQLMHGISSLFIRHFSNGWLWTEAFLKPIDNVLRVTLFLMAWAVLFLFYGWDQQSPVVERLTKLLHYQFIHVLNTAITPWNILEVLVVVALFYWAVRWTREFVYRLLLSRTKDMGIRNSIAILSQYSMIALGIFICLRVLGIDFRALAVVAGMFSLGIGLGLRDIANNFVCGFLLLIERPIRVGDTVTINEYEGDVIHIGGRAVTIRTWDHMEVLVPNAEIFSKSFTNWTARDNVVRTVIDIKINFHDKPQDLQAKIFDVLRQLKNVLKEPIPEVFLKEMNDGMIEFEVRYYINIRQVSSRMGVRSEVLVAIWDMFEKNNIKLPYPHHEIFVKGNA